MNKHFKSHLKLLMVFIILIIPYLFNNNSYAQEYRLGPSGGYGGSYFEDSATKKDSRVVEVIIRADKFINSLQIIHISGDSREPLNKHGGTGGRKHSFKLEKNEYITGISGRYGRFVDSIRIHTNKKTSPKYGGSGGGSEYRYEAPKGTEIVGFLGRSGKLIDAIGVIIRR